MTNESYKNKLYAINTMLEHINEYPIDSLEDLDAVLEAQRADAVLEEVKTDVLSEEWDINTDDDWEMTPNSDGIIGIPSNVLDIASTDGDSIMRDWKLYSRTSKSFKYESSVNCKVVWNLDFNNLTHPIRKYITIKAARIFAKRYIGDTKQFDITGDEELQARISARQSENRTGQYSWRDGISTAFSRTSTF